MSDLKAAITSQVQEAYQNQQALQIQAGGTKHFYGRKIEGESLAMLKHTGIVEYEPSELFITANSGTSLNEIEHTVAQQNQMLPFEPPHFGSSATLGGMVAAGLSGPRRATLGAVRDCILGTDIINGKGDYLQFGGRVMKNVAGYDVSRLMCGALGTLGVLMSITLRLTPKPPCEQTIAISLNANEAIQKMNQWANSAMPISATFYAGNDLYSRLSGSLSTIQACVEIIGGDPVDWNDVFWKNIKEHAHEFFLTDLPLWRISVPPNTSPLNISGSYVMEWNGALRWYATEANANEIRSEVEHAGGHACLFRSNDSQQIFHPLAPASLNIHRKLKQAFDPARILNPGKMYAEC